MNFPNDCSLQKKNEITKKDKAQIFEKLIDYINNSDLDGVIASLKGFLIFLKYIIKKIIIKRMFS